VAIEEVVAGQVFNGRRTSLRAGSASQVFARSRTASEDKDAGHRLGDSASVGHAFKTGVPARAGRRVRFPSASAGERRTAQVPAQARRAMASRVVRTRKYVRRVELRSGSDRSGDCVAEVI